MSQLVCRGYEDASLLPVVRKSFKSEKNGNIECKRIIPPLLVWFMFLHLLHRATRPNGERLVAMVIR